MASEKLNLLRSFAGGAAIAAAIRGPTSRAKRTSSRSGGPAKGYNPAIVSIPLRLDDSIRVGVVRRGGIQLSAAGAAFVDAIRAHLAGK